MDAVSPCGKVGGDRVSYVQSRTADESTVGARPLRIEPCNAAPKAAAICLVGVLAHDRAQRQFPHVQTVYHLHYGGENHGPYLLDQIRGMWASGIITADAVYWNEAASAWEPLTDLLKASPPFAPKKESASPPPLPLTLEANVRTSSPRKPAKSRASIGCFAILASGALIIAIGLVAWLNRGRPAPPPGHTWENARDRDDYRIVPDHPVGTTQPAAENSTQIDMVREDGVPKVPVELNGAITLKFVVDSGASSVQIPQDVALTLVRAETIKESDFLPGRVFTLADGSKVKSDRLRLRSIKVGETTVSDVEACVGGPGASLLLGQSFLSRFKEVKIDNTNATLILRGMDMGSRTARADQGSSTPAPIVRSPTATAPARAFPQSGKILFDAYPNSSAIGSLEVTNDSAFHAVVKLVVTGTNRKALSFAIQGHEKTTIEGIPEGAYSAIFSLGTDLETGTDRFTKPEGGWQFHQPLRYDSIRGHSNSFRIGDINEVTSIGYERFNSY